MRWVNTGYSISFRCWTAVVLDSAGILFFTTGANANCALIVFICYHIVGMWKSLLACQPLCPTWLCHLLMCHCRQSGTSVTTVGACTQTGPATADSQPGAWTGLFQKPLGPLSWWFQQAVTEVWMVTWFWFFTPHSQKNRFYSKAFKNIWTLPWPCGLLIVPSLFQISDPTPLHIMSVSSRDFSGIRFVYVCSRTSPVNHRMGGEGPLFSPYLCAAPVPALVPVLSSVLRVHANCKSLFQGNIQISTLRLILMQI